MHAPQGYGSRSVCLSVRLSGNGLIATYLVYTLGAARLFVTNLTHALCGFR